MNQHDPLPFRVAVHIGYHKTATTWFQRVGLNEHPEILPVPRYPAPPAGSDGGLVESLAMTSDAAFDVSATRSAFVDQVARHDVGDRVVVVSAERLSGHSGGGGYDGPRIAARLHAVLPEAKVFWLLRDRTRSIRSNYKQLVRQGWTGTVRQTLETPPWWRKPGFDLSYWEYDRLLGFYAERFGRDHIHVADYSAFRADPAAVLRSLASFLEIADWELTDDHFGVRVNTSESDLATRTKRVLNHASVSEFNPYPLVRVPPRVVRAAVRWADGARGRPLFGADFEQWVEARFEASDERLAELGFVLGRETTS